MARGRKAGTPITPKGPMPKSYFMNKTYMVKWDKRQGTLWIKGNNDSENNEIIDEEKDEEDADTKGYSASGYFGYYNMNGLFGAIKRDMRLRGFKDKKVTEEMDEFIEVWQSAENKFNKYMSKFNIHLEVSDEIKTKAKEIQHQLGGDVVEKEPVERKPRTTKPKEEKTKTEANLEKLSKKIKTR